MSIDQKLIEIAELIAGRKLTDSEKVRLSIAFHNARGSIADRVKEAINRALGITEEQYEKASSDASDRSIDDLKDAINKSK